MIASPTREVVTVSRQRPTRDELVDRYRLEWLQERATAETMPCEACSQPAGETCRNLATGEPLQRLPAHGARIRAYAAAPPASSAA